MFFRTRSLAAFALLVIISSVLAGPTGNGNGGGHGNGGGTDGGNGGGNGNGNGNENNHGSPSPRCRNPLRRQEWSVCIAKYAELFC